MVFHLYRNRRGTLALLFAIFLMAVVAAPVARATTITVINNDGAGEGFNDPTPVTPVGGNPGTTLGEQRFNAFQYAADIWAGLIVSPVTIRIGAQFNPLTCSSTSAVLGSAGPVSVAHDFTGAPVPNTLYAIALANSLHGSDISPGSDDITAQFNSAIGTTCSFPLTWYYGLDANPGSQIDFVSVVLHELGHGLGFLTFVDLTTGAKFSGLNDTFMLNLEDHGAVPSDYPSMTNAQRVTASKDTGNLHWVGANVQAASGVLSAGTVGTHVRMYAPNPQQAGSSVSHFDTALSPNELMEPNYTGPLHDVGLALELFQDLGWAASVAPPFNLAPLTLPTGQVEVNYDTPLVTGGLGPYTFTFPKEGAFPPGLSFDVTNGHLVGTPSAKKTSKFTLQITDSTTASATGTFKLKVLGALNIITTSLKAGTSGKAYKAKLKARKGLKPYNWTEVTSILAAAGLTLDPLTGVISGTVASSTTIDFTVQVTDPMGGVDQQDLSLTIN